MRFPGEHCCCHFHFPSHLGFQNNNNNNHFLRTSHFVQARIWALGYFRIHACMQVACNTPPIFRRDGFQAFQRRFDDICICKKKGSFFIPLCFLYWYLLHFPSLYSSDTNVPTHPRASRGIPFLVYLVYESSKKNFYTYYVSTFSIPYFVKYPKTLFWKWLKVPKSSTTTLPSNESIYKYINCYFFLIRSFI